MNLSWKFFLALCPATVSGIAGIEITDTILSREDIPRTTIASRDETFVDYTFDIENHLLRDRHRRHAPVDAGTAIVPEAPPC
ncbi:MAG: hypothetical protein LBK99_14470 [Opitutaceae bacterium]|jgi:hypothetical protein|nr:hypothetical protein [Opitutaceae bacterium]